MIKRYLSRCLAALALLAIPLGAKPKPNVVIFLTDDQGWGDLSITGNPHLKTPHIDSLAGQGVILDRFYVQPVCSPTRAEFLTGRYHTRTGIVGVTSGGERLNLDEATVADSLKAAGYATGAFGKWHNGTQWPYHPNARGFEKFYGFCSGHWGLYFSPQLEHNGRLVQGESYIIDDFTNRAIDFIKKNKDGPFFCYLPYCTPHSPMQVPDEYWQRFADMAIDQKDQKSDALDHTRAALAMCENIDSNVGRLLATLDQLEIADNTIVIFFSDNGPNGHRWNGGMRGIKGSTDEGGVRVPCFIRWPAQLPQGRRVEEIAAAIDLLPTLVELCGIRNVGSKPLDGRSLQPLLFGEPVDWSARHLFQKWGKRVSVRNQRYRLDFKDRLYDMQMDPGQTRDIAKQMPELTAELKRAKADWLAETMPSGPPAARPFTVGHAIAEQTLLPARDGQATGTIRRSSRHPNCSYFTNWTSPADAITWDVEVLTAGTYEAIIHYTCKPEDVGTELKLSFGETSVSSTITEPHDPPIQGEVENRVYKHESFVKAFKPHPLGQIELPEGTGSFTLTATRILGNEAIELRYLVLRRVGSDH